MSHMALAEKKNNSRHTNPFDDAEVINYLFNRAGRVNFSSCRLWLFVCLVYLFLVLLCFCLLWFLFCFLFFFRHRDGCIGPCKGPPTVRPLLVHLFTKMTEFSTALINGQHAACNSVLIDLAKAKRRWTEKNQRNCSARGCLCHPVV